VQFFVNLYFKMQSISNHKTAILVFARSSKEEVAHKSIYNGTQLFDTLTAYTLETASKTCLPYFHFSEEQQIGLTFGERFANAVQAVFEKGYEQIITIGNDSPKLKASHILEAEKRLSSNKLVLGPSADGGFYLMGLHKSQFDPHTFRELAWQTSDVSKELLALESQGNNEVFKLDTLYDIDTQEDIKSIISYTYRLSKNLLVALINTLGSQGNRHAISSQEFQSLVFGIRHNKGSPGFPSL